MSSAVALITGGTRGIGFGIAKALAADERALFLVGRRPRSDVEEALSPLRALGVEVGYLAQDVAAPDAPARILDAVATQFGRLDFLINNAAVPVDRRGDLLEVDPDGYSRVLQTNLGAPFFLTQRASRWMIEQRHAHPDRPMGVVNVSSISATVASVDRGEYCIAKAGLSMVTQLFAIRLAEHRVPVYEIRPGIVATDMTAPVRERYDRQIEQGLLLEPRWGRPEDVGRATAALLRGEIPYATGQVLVLDGGLTCPRL